MKSASRGPGALDTTRLIGGGVRSARLRPLYQRTAALYGRGGVSSDQSDRSSTPSRLLCSLAPLVVAWTSSIWATGSARWTGSDTNRVETLLARKGAPSLRVDTGTPATSALSGVAPDAAR